MSEATQAVLGTIGIWLLVAAGVTIIVEMAVMAMWGAAMAKRVRTLTEMAASERAELEADLRKLRAAMEETKRLWRPYRRALRWLQHPLLVALIGSYRRRWANR